MILCYRFLTIFFYPVFIVIIFFRKFFNKEDKKRYKEKIFSTSFSPVNRKQKKLIWFHAASIGEVQSIFPVVSKLNKKNKNLDFLITTVTLSSGILVNKKFKNDQNIYHRYFPIDVIFLVRKFLDEWRPDLVLFVDSEIWPNFILEIDKREIKSVVINARITKKSFNKWMLVPRFAKKIFNSFELCLASSIESKKYLKKLNAKNLKYYGNLKLSSSVKFKEVKDKNKIIFKNRKIWCAASTHRSEEIVCLKTHINLKKKQKNLLTIIIPRHINRSNEIKKLCQKLNLRSQILKENDLIKKDKEVVIINSFGLLPIYFRYSKSVFMGKSIVKELEETSGQNPIEAAKLGCKVYHGPFVNNFKEIYKFLKMLGITEEITNDKILAIKILRDFKNSQNSKNKIIKKITNLGDRILKNNVREVQKLII